MSTTGQTLSPVTAKLSPASVPADSIGLAGYSASGLQQQRRRRSALFAGAACSLALALALALGSDRRPASAAAGVGLNGPAPTGVAQQYLRVASFNIHSGRDRQGRTNLERTARAIAEVDLVALYEVRSSGAWFGGDQAQWLGQRLGLAWLYAPSERRWGHNHWGNALLAGARVGAWRTTPLVGTRGKAYRNFVVAEVEFHGTTLRVLLTHLDTHTDRAAQLATVLAEFERLPAPALLMGDLNTDASDPQLVRLLQLPDVECCGPPGAARHIDWIVARGLHCRAAGLREEGASDHPCAWAELELAPRLARKPAAVPAR